MTPLDEDSIHTLSPEHRRWFVVDQTVFPAFLNVVLNAGIAWLIFRAHSQLMLWGADGVGSDLLITGFILPFAICSINSFVIRNQVRRGKIAALSPVSNAVGLARMSPWIRAVVLAVVGVVVGALPMLLVVGALEPLSIGAFVGLKGIWAGLLAAAVSPVVAWWALVSTSSSPAVAHAPKPAGDPVQLDAKKG